MDNKDKKHEKSSKGTKGEKSSKSHKSKDKKYYLIFIFQNRKIKMIQKFLSLKKLISQK